MENFPWYELLYAVAGVVLGFLSQYFGLKLPPLKKPTEPNDPPGGGGGVVADDFSLPGEPVALRRHATEVAEQHGMDPEKLKVLDLGTLALITTLLVKYGPVVYEAVRAIIDAIWSRQADAKKTAEADLSS